MSAPITPTKAAETALHQMDRTTWHMRVINVIGILLMLAIVTTFGVINTVSTNKSLKILVNATSLKTQARAQAATAAAVRQLIVCINNHNDRLHAQTVHLPLPPIPPDCPAK